MNLKVGNEVTFCGKKEEEDEFCASGKIIFLDTHNTMDEDELYILVRINTVLPHTTNIGWDKRQGYSIVANNVYNLLDDCGVYWWVSEKEIVRLSNRKIMETE